MTALTGLLVLVPCGGGGLILVLDMGLGIRPAIGINLAAGFGGAAVVAMA